MEYLLLIYILASFVGAGKRMFERDVTFANFLKFIGEFIGYPVVRAYEEFKIDITK